MAPTKDLRGDEPLWYKDAVIYELHVKAFTDSNGDGVGDFAGLHSRLDYISDLGATAIWLLPFYPSPLRDDGYDIADSRGVHPDYGTLRHFREFLRAAHHRGIRVITELVLNHTSDQHEWFQQARQAKPGSRRRDFYVWSDTPDRYADARVIFQDFEISNWSWDPVAKAYYWHRFYSHQPDLNFENPSVKRAIFKIIDFWFDMGVDGLRLDAVPYLFEREGTNCENLPETHAFLKELRAHVDRRYPNRMLLAEANQWPEDAAAYFGDGDECHMAFHFPLMPRMFMAVRMEDSFPVTDILEQTPSVNAASQWALFLRNHDELTLEMVTDEERDYMYRVFADDPRARINLGIRRRLAPLLGNNRRKIELMSIMLLTLPGTPVIYYGDEIGMGDNYYLGDRDGVRTPMQWSSDRNAGFSRANPQRLFLPVIIDPEYHYEAVNVENQAANPSSLLWWMRRTLAMRKRFKAFGRGSIRLVPSENPRTLAYLREFDDESILILVNLSRFSQAVELDLSEFAEMSPEDVFSLGRFPSIKKEPYTFMLGPHGYYILQLLKVEAEATLAEEGALPEITALAGWQALLRGRTRERLEKEVLPKYLCRTRWFDGKARTMRSVLVAEAMPLGKEEPRTYLCVLRITYTEGDPEHYFLPLCYLSAEMAASFGASYPQALIARFKTAEDEGFLCDAAYRTEFQEVLLAVVSRRRKIRSGGCELSGVPGSILHRGIASAGDGLGPAALKAEQSNTSILFGDSLILKLYRRLDRGLNPDLEISRFLTEKGRFAHTPAHAGALYFGTHGTGQLTLGQLQGYLPNTVDGWSYTLDTVGRYFERVLSRRDNAPLDAGRRADDDKQKGEPTQAELGPDLFSLPDQGEDIPAAVPPVIQDVIGTFYLEMASLIGQRTAELHIALGTTSRAQDFAPETFSQLYQRSVFQSMRSHTRRTLELLRKSVRRIQKNRRPLAERVLDSEKRIMDCYAWIKTRKLSAMKIRIHGDYHLGHLLFTGKDFFIIDFEGEPTRPLGERRLRRSCLRDVAGMIRSFHYASMGRLILHPQMGEKDVPRLETWAECWYRYVTHAFLSSYLLHVRGHRFLPEDRTEIVLLLRAFLLEKAVYEIGYELNNRPDWLEIPLKGVLQLMGSTP